MKTTRLWLTCAPLLLIIPLAGGRTSAAPISDPTVSLTRAQAADFQKALAALSAQGHAALVAEGTPLKPHLQGTDVPDMTKPQPLAKAVAALAAAYDYDVTRGDGGVFVLTKRYTDSSDLPGVTLPECVQAAKDVFQVLDTFSPHFQQSVYVDGPDDQRQTIVNFVASLSPMQQQALDGKTLHYGDLSPDQQTLIQRFFLYQYVQTPADSVEAAVNEIQYGAQSVLTGRDETGHSGLYIEMPVPPNAVVKTSKDDKHYLLSLMNFTTPVVLLSRQNGPAPMTLAAVVASLGPISGIPSTVEGELKDKPVTVAGLAGVPPMDALRALETVYGLRIGVSDAGGNELERMPAPVPDNLSEISADVWEALPAPLARALHFWEGADAAVTMPKNGDAAAYRRWKQADDKRWQTRLKLEARPSEMARAAAERVWEAIQPQLKAHGPDARIPVSSLDVPTRTALAVLLMSGLMNTLYNQYGGRPNQLVLDGLENLDQMVIYSNPKETANVRGQLVPSLHMETVDPYTNEKVGMGGTVYSSIP